MSKFKVGDKVIRVQDVGELLPVGTVGTVRGVNSTGRYIRVTGYKGGYNEDNFEHYVEQPPVDSTAVLTPLKVFEHILAGTPLEYRTFSGSNWHTLEYSENINTASFKVAEFRVKPQTVKVNGIAVPTPLSKSEIDGLKSGSAYSVDTLNRTTPWVRAIHDKQLLWSTKEDAQAVLDAILTSFSK